MSLGVDVNVLGKLQAAIELTKPRALVMIVFTTCISFLIAVNGPVPWWALIHTAIGVMFAGGGSLVLNQHM